MTTVEQKAFLLHRQPYKENQLLVSLITENYGKVAAVTYTGSSTKSNKKALLQPFIPLTINISGRSTLKKLTQVEMQSIGYNYQGNMLYSGFYLNELSLKLLPELIPVQSLFYQYQDSLQALTNNLTNHQLELVLRHYESLLLEELGLSLDFSYLINNFADTYHFSPENGFTVINEDIKQSKQLDIYRREDLLAIAQEDYTRHAMAAFKRLMRQYLKHLLGNRELNSRKFFKPING